MKTLQGKPISPGCAEGRAVIYDLERIADVPRYRIAQAAIESEHRRFQAALERACRELQELAQRVLAEFGRAESQIVSAHLTLLTDPTFVEKVRQRVHCDLVNAEEAVSQEVADLATLFSAMENAYLREREQDIRDVGRRVLRHLARGPGGALQELPPDSVIVAGELLPSDTLSLDRTRLAAIVTERGGATSHVAILARSIGVPAVTGVFEATREIEPGTHLLVDGDAGEVVVQPGRRRTTLFLREKQRREQVAAAAAECRECVTQDGVRVVLYANIGCADEVRQVDRHYLEGVGLFRTECLFLEAMEPPRLETHESAYRRAAEGLGKRPLVVRTLDLGGDKQPPFLMPHLESSPNQGLRGLRFALSERSLLETQLRAMVSVASLGDLRILFPMVLGGDDLREAVEMLEGIARQAGLDRPPPVGAMIETPASLFALDEILQLADFLSIGTNDLTQYMLAADRNIVGLVDEFSMLHPAVLRAIHRVVKRARAKDRPVCVCGEAAGDPHIAPLLVGLGLRELSLSPVRAARVRHALRQVSCAEMEHLAQEALRCDTPACVRRLLPRFENLPEFAVK